MMALPSATTTGRRQPIRTCVACRMSGGKRGFLRVVRLPGALGMALDLTGKKSGRGAYVCSTEACLAQALKRKALERALKAPLSDEVIEALRAAIRALDPPDGGSEAI